MDINMNIYDGKSLYNEKKFFGRPQFVAINFIFDIYNPDYITKSLILSELPALFKKYNIKLNKNDINVFVSNIYNLIQEKEFKQKIDFIEQIENMSYVKDPEMVTYLKLARNLYEIYQKIIKFDMKDKLIEKMIYERYDYYFNKNDKLSYEKFKKFLNDNIPQNGYYDVDEINNIILSECKMNWIDIKEQEVRKFFYELKYKFYPNKPIVFQSIRFYYVYLHLKTKYPEIAIDVAEMENNLLTLKQKMNAVYVNDIYGDNQYKNKFNDYVVMLPFELHTILCNSKDMLNHFFDLNEEQIKQIYKEHYNSKRKVTYGSAESIDEIINLLEYERRILKTDDVFLTSIDGLPEMFIPYFSFCLSNHEQIEYFKSRIKEESDKNRIIYEMKLKYGKEAVFRLLIDLLLDDKLINHELISNNDINIEKRKIKNLKKYRELYVNKNVKK